jgi:L-iditol 2-dehydrogenase
MFMFVCVLVLMEYYYTIVLFCHIYQPGLSNPQLLHAPLGVHYYLFYFICHFTTTFIASSILTHPQETRHISPPQDDELQIAIKATGICGSDVSYYKKFANGDLCACSPLSLGHESSGVVVAMGAQVRNFALGDRVALEVGIPCGNCGVCRGGRYNLCKKMRFRSSAKSVPHFQGTLQERINHPARWCYK